MNDYFRDIKKSQCCFLFISILQDIVERDAENHYGSRFYPSLSRDLKDALQTAWGHHRYIIDKCSSCQDKALFFVHQTVENGWSRNILLNFLDTDLYERQGKALTNFNRTLPEETSDLAQEITKDPYDFAFTGITGRYNEQLLKE